MSRWAALWARWRGTGDAPADVSRVPPRSLAVCWNCRHFRNDPAEIEAALPGLASLGSGYGSTSGDDGLCLKHDRFVTMASSCSAFRIRRPAA